MNNFFQHSTLREFSVQLSLRYFATIEHIEKMMAEECQYELERLELKNTYNNREKTMESVKDRIRTWTESDATQEPITSEKLVSYRIPYLYFTRLIKR